MNNEKEVARQSIGAIKAILSKCAIKELDTFVKEYEMDERAGVMKLVATAQKRMEAYQVEMDRVRNMMKFDMDLGRGKAIVGVDEVGRGPLAGPVVTAAVMMPMGGDPIAYVNDSKKVSEKKREALYDEIMATAVSVSIGVRDVATIDEHNILQATLMAMTDAVLEISEPYDYIIADALTIPDVLGTQYKIIKGDEKSYNVAAASIVAKVTRDRMMVAYDELFPGYDFAGNKGYGAPVHIEAIKTIGPCPIHRRTFIKNFL